MTLRDYCEGWGLRRGDPWRRRPHLDATRLAQGLPPPPFGAMLSARSCGAISARPTGWTTPPSAPRSPGQPPGGAVPARSLSDAAQRQSHTVIELPSSGCMLMTSGHRGLVQLLEELPLQICCSSSGDSLSTQFLVVIGKPGFRSQRRREQGRHGEAIEEDQLVADFEALSQNFEPVAVEAGCEQPGFAFLVGLKDGERCLDH